MDGFFSNLEPNVAPLRRKLVKLQHRYIAPPFSVLDSRQGYWQDRKREWLALGIKSELGRGENLIGLRESNEEYRYNKKEYFAKQGKKGTTAVDCGGSGWAGNRGAKVGDASPGGSPRPAMRLGKNGKTQRGNGRGHVLAGAARTKGSGGPGNLGAQYNGASARAGIGPCRGPSALAEYYKTGKAIPGGGTGKNSAFMFKTSGVPAAGPEAQAHGTGTSIFDPVLCELMYKWFCPPNGNVLDPFAGGSVRGIVAGVLGRQYTGIDLSPRQLANNLEQAQRIVPDNLPTWIEGDGQNVGKLVEGPFDFIFSCPPYFGLEQYSNHPADLSNMTHEEFLAVYRKIIRRSVRLLKPNRFACFVVGNTRKEDHNYSHLPGETVKAFEDAGAMLYNDAVLLTAIGSLPLRVGKQFESARKLGRTHQNVLIFVKGDYKKAVRVITGKKKAR